MGLLRGRRDAGGLKYRMREKLFAIGDDYWIENDAGERVFKVNGKALRIRDTFIIEDASGTEPLRVQEKKRKPLPWRGKRLNSGSCSTLGGASVTGQTTTANSPQCRRSDS
jgi:LURP-one-related